MFAKAVVRRGLPPTGATAQVTLRIASDGLDWFGTKGQGYQTQINPLLRTYIWPGRGIILSSKYPARVDVSIRLGTPYRLTSLMPQTERVIQELFAAADWERGGKTIARGTYVHRCWLT